MLGYIKSIPYLYYINDKHMNTKKTPLPKHRKLLMESMELLFSGKKAEFKKTVKKAKLEVDKFYLN
jgi:hypothetical protein